MPPVLLDMLTGAMRHLVAATLLWLVSKGYLGSGLAAQSTEALTVVLVSIAASAYSKYTANEKLVVAQVSAPGITQAEIQAKIASGAPIPSVLTAAEQRPVPVAAV